MIIRSSVVAIFLFISIYSSYGQAPSKFRYELGAGISLLGTGDVLALNIENELDYLLSSNIETSVSFVNGRGFVSYDSFSNAFIQGNFNLALLPFGNYRSYALKLGVGISYQSFHGVNSLIGGWVNGEFVVNDYSVRNLKQFGYNLIIENAYKLSEKYSISFKIFAQPFRNGDINSGGILKLGYQL